MIVSVIAALLLVPSVAVAQYSIDYFGEITDITSYGTLEGEVNSSDDLWDYVYELEGGNVHPNFGPHYWAIVVPFQPIIQDTDYWLGTWDAEINADDVYFDYFEGTAVEGRSCVVWEYDQNSNPSPTSTGRFHFQSNLPPEIVAWVVQGDRDAYDGSGTEWSASPEPASMLLTSLALFGVGYWRRKKTR